MIVEAFVDFDRQRPVSRNVENDAVQENGTVILRSVSITPDNGEVFFEGELVEAHEAVIPPRAMKRAQITRRGLFLDMKDRTVLESASAVYIAGTHVYYV